MSSFVAVLPGDTGKEALRHLLDAKAALLRERHELDTKISRLNAVIARLDTGQPVMRNAIEDLIRTAGPIRSGELTSALAESFGWAEASVRSLLSKMAKEGRITRKSWGVYC